jgi:hypothetical protein
MTSLRLDGRLGGDVPVDLCETCQLIWFDHLESLKLSPGATLRLFRVIGERRRMSPAPIAASMTCPRCPMRLRLTFDRQRNTQFRYWRCARDHGRLITFFEFLREKDFIKPASPDQLAELKANIQTINCSNCGAPVDLVRGSACTHCGSPLSVLDLKQIQRVADELGEEDLKSKTPDPTLPQRLAMEKLEVETMFSRLRAEGAWDSSSPLGLVEAGLWFLARKLRSG